QVPPPAGSTGGGKARGSLASAGWVGFAAVPSAGGGGARLFPLRGVRARPSPPPAKAPSAVGVPRALSRRVGGVAGGGRRVGLGPSEALRVDHALFASASASAPRLPSAFPACSIAATASVKNSSSSPGSFSRSRVTTITGITIPPRVWPRARPTLLTLTASHDAPDRTSAPVRRLLNSPADRRRAGAQCRGEGADMPRLMLVAPQRDLPRPAW